MKTAAAKIIGTQSIVNGKDTVMNNKLRYLIIPAMSIALLFGLHNSSAQVVISRSIPSDSIPNINDTITVAINIDMTGMAAPDTLLGSYSADLKWNPNILAYVSNSGPLQGFTGFVNTAGADTGRIRFNGAKPTGQNGVFDVLVVTFAVIGFPGQSTTLDLEYSAMAAAFTFTNLLPYLSVGDGSITIAGVGNIPPVLDSILNQTMFEGDTITVPIFATDPDGQTITLTTANLPSFGSLTDSGNGTGSLLFTPGYSQSGSYQNIQVIATDNGAPPLSDTSYFALTVMEFNLPPTAVNDNLMVIEDSSGTINPLVNDINPDNDPLVVILVSNPPNGTATINTGDTTVTYRPDPNFFGADSFIYRIFDGLNTDSATIFVDVTPVNDDPVIIGLPDTIMFAANTTTSIDVWSGVSDETADSLLTYNFFAAPDTLILSFNATNGMLDISAKDIMHATNADLFIMVQDPQGAGASDTIFVMVDPPVGINDPFADQIPVKYELSQNFPNPFNPTTHIRFGLPKASTVEINLYNVMGQRVAIILDEYKPAGYHTINFDASHLASGVYFFSIKAGGFKDVKKMIFMK